MISAKVRFFLFITGFSLLGIALFLSLNGPINVGQKWLTVGFYHNDRGAYSEQADRLFFDAIDQALSGLKKKFYLSAEEKTLLEGYLLALKAQKKERELLLRSGQSVDVTETGTRLLLIPFYSTGYTMIIFISPDGLFTFDLAKGENGIVYRGYFLSSSLLLFELVEYAHQGISESYLIGYRFQNGGVARVLVIPSGYVKQTENGLIEVNSQIREGEGDTIVVLQYWSVADRDGENRYILTPLGKEGIYGARLLRLKHDFVLGDGMGVLYPKGEEVVLLPDYFDQRSAGYYRERYLVVRPPGEIGGTPLVCCIE